MSDPTKTVFDELPAIESVVTMTATEKAYWQAKLDAALTEQGIAYQSANTAAELAQEHVDTARKAWETEHQDIITRATDTAKHAAELKVQLQRGAAFRRALTGETSWQAFQAAKEAKPIYDEKAMLTWIVYEAPRAAALTLLALNKKAVNEFVINRREENRDTIRSLEGCAPIPATCKDEFTGKVLANKLPLLKPLPTSEIDMDMFSQTAGFAHIATLTSPQLSPIGEKPVISSDTATEPQTGWWYDLDTNTVEFATYTINQRKDRRLSGPYETQIEAQAAAIPF